MSKRQQEFNREYYESKLDESRSIKFSKLDHQGITVESINGSSNGHLSLQYRRTANVRERIRMQNMTSAFQKLKTKLPWIPRDTKLSKVDTLRLAALYIKMLMKILNDDEKGAETLFAESSQPWPWHHKAYFAQLSNESSPQETQSASKPANNSFIMDDDVFGDNVDFFNFNSTNFENDIADIWNQLESLH